MKRQLFPRILIGIVTLLLLMVLSVKVFIEPWIAKKIQAAINESSKDYRIEAGKIHVLMMSSFIEFNCITIRTKQERGDLNVNGQISSIKLYGVNFLKVLLKKDIDIREVLISKGQMTGKIPFSMKEKPPMVFPMNLRIDCILFYKIDLTIENTSNAQAYSVKEGTLKLYGLQVEKQDTLSRNIVKQFDFKAKEFLSVSSDSMYTFKVVGIDYSANSGLLAVNSIIIHPNYSDYHFTARRHFSTDCVDGHFKNIFVRGFSAAAYYKFNHLRISDIEIGRMDLNIFRDNRKKSRHINKPTFQEMIYNYPGTICLDSIHILKGKITYTEHAKMANRPGSIHFDQIHASIFKITNDTIYKTKYGLMELKAEALLMGKGKLNVSLKAKLFDHSNTFSLKGNLSAMNARELESMLRNHAFVNVQSGQVDAMKFNFTANNKKSTGKMTLLYHGLHIAVLNKKTDKSTALKEQFISFIANLKVPDSNPLPGEDVRVGIIDYARNPEKFLFNYCFKSILSGFKSSLVKNPKKIKKE
ncbi:MAG: hypothetical protein VB110_07605 [Bacteroidales bacterium]|nr:hypothetical protein [Bacteroidales bacterium]